MSDAGATRPPIIPAPIDRSALLAELIEEERRCLENQKREQMRRGSCGSEQLYNGDVTIAVPRANVVWNEGKEPPVVDGPVEMDPARKRVLDLLRRGAPPP